MRDCSDNGPVSCVTKGIPSSGSSSSVNSECEWAGEVRFGEELSWSDWALGLEAEVCRVAELSEPDWLDIALREARRERVSR